MQTQSRGAVTVRYCTCKELEPAKLGSSGPANSAGVRHQVLGTYTSEAVLVPYYHSRVTINDLCSS